MFGDYEHECTNKTMRGNDERQKTASSLDHVPFLCSFFRLKDA